jgi:hypothetical protein
MYAYRAEVGGIYGWLAFTNTFLEQHQITHGSITKACDCRSVLCAICKLISFILETTKDMPVPSVAVLLGGAYWRLPRVCCAADESARVVCVRKGCAGECSVVVISSFIGGVVEW